MDLEIRIKCVGTVDEREREHAFPGCLFLSGIYGALKLNRTLEGVDDRGEF